MIYLLLAYEFFKIGLFSFGGGYATIPFLYDISVRHNWYTIQELSNMTAVASITPGPVGINAATYAGMKTGGILGSLCATISEVIPSLIFVLIISKLLKKYNNNYYVKTAIEILKPISCALLLSVSISMLKPYLFNIRALILLFILLTISIKTKKDPLLYIIIAGIAGVINIICTNT